MSSATVDRKVVLALIVNASLVILVKWLNLNHVSMWIVGPLAVVWILAVLRLLAIIPGVPYDYFFDRGVGWSIVYAGYWLLVLIPFRLSRWGVIIPVGLVVIGWVYALMRWPGHPADDSESSTEPSSAV